MSDAKSQLERNLEKGYSFDISQFVEKGFEIFKKNLGQFLAFTIAFLVLSVILQSLGSFGNFINSLVSTPLILGSYAVAHKVNKNEPTETNDFFSGFEVFFPLVVISIFTTLVYSALIMPMLGFNIFSSFTGSTPEEQLTLEVLTEQLSQVPSWTYLCIIPLFYLMVSWFWAPQFAYFYRLNAFEAIEMSRRYTAQNWWIILLFLILIGAIVIIGMFFLLVGVIFTLPLAFCINYAAFAHVTRLNDHQSSEDIMDHLVE